MTVPTEEPPQVSGPTYGSMDVSSIRIHSEPTLATHGTTKQYVDGKVADVKSEILGGASPVWDTLKEIQVFDHLIKYFLYHAYFSLNFS